MKTRLFKLTLVSALLVLLVPTYGSSQADTFLMRLHSGGLILDLLGMNGPLEELAFRRAASG